MREDSIFVRAVVTIALVAVLALVPAWPSPAETLCDSGVVVGAVDPQLQPPTTTTALAVRPLVELAHEAVSTVGPDAVVASRLEPTTPPSAGHVRGLGPKSVEAGALDEAISGASKVSRNVGPEAFKQARPGYATGSHEIHHAVEWNVLNRYPGTFTPEELNFDAMMRPVLKGQRMQGAALHRSIIRKSWDAFRDVYKPRFDAGLISPARMRAIILRHRDFIDRMYLRR